MLIVTRCDKCPNMRISGLDEETVCRITPDRRWGWLPRIIPGDHEPDGEVAIPEWCPLPHTTEQETGQEKRPWTT